MRRVRGLGWWPHAVLAVVGLLIVLYPFTLGRTPAVTCRGVELRPGQTCAKADGSATQTYEQRAAAAQAARPVVVGVGLAVLAFGGYLTLSAVRSTRTAARPTARTDTDPAPAAPPQSGGVIGR